MLSTFAPVFVTLSLPRVSPMSRLAALSLIVISRCRSFIISIASTPPSAASFTSFCLCFSRFASASAASTRATYVALTLAASRPFVMRRTCASTSAASTSARRKRPSSDFIRDFIRFTSRSNASYVDRCVAAVASYAAFFSACRASSSACDALASRRRLICGASFPFRSFTFLLISWMNALISSSASPFRSSTLALALETSSNVSDAAANPVTPARRSSSATSPDTSDRRSRKISSVDASVVASAATSSSSRFSCLYLASFAFTVSNFCRISSSSPPPPAPRVLPPVLSPPSVRTAPVSYSDVSRSRRARSLSRFARVASLFAATLFATCACCRSAASASRAFVRTATLSSSSLVSACSALTSSVARRRSESARASDANTSLTATDRARFFSSASGSFSLASARAFSTSSDSAAISALGFPDAVDARCSRSRTAARWYLASDASFFSYCSRSALASSISSSRAARSDVAWRVSAATRERSSTLDAILPFTTATRDAMASFSRSNCVARCFSLTGSFPVALAASTALWISTNCRCSSCLWWISSWTSSSRVNSGGTGTSARKCPTYARFAHRSRSLRTNRSAGKTTSCSPAANPARIVSASVDGGGAYLACRRKSRSGSSPPWWPRASRASSPHAGTIAANASKHSSRVASGPSSLRDGPVREAYRAPPNGGSLRRATMNAMSSPRTMARRAGRGVRRDARDFQSRLLFLRVQCSRKFFTHPQFQHLIASPFN
eukprot:30041-Pelagococcus_subviridis.AAC.4